MPQEVSNGRLFRLVCKLNSVIERQEWVMNTAITWLLFHSNEHRLLLANETLLLCLVQELPNTMNQSGQRPTIGTCWNCSVIMCSIKSTTMGHRIWISHTSFLPSTRLPFTSPHSPLLHLGTIFHYPVAFLAGWSWIGGECVSSQPEGRESDNRDLCWNSWLVG